MAIHHEQQQVVAHPVSPGLGSIQQLGYLAGGQVVPGTFVMVGGISRGIRATLYLSPFGRGRRHVRNPLQFGQTNYHTFNKMRVL